MPEHSNTPEPARSLTDDARKNLAVELIKDDPLMGYKPAIEKIHSVLVRDLGGGKIEFICQREPDPDEMIEFPDSETENPGVIEFYDIHYFRFCVSKQDGQLLNCPDAQAADEILVCLEEMEPVSLGKIQDLVSYVETCERLPGSTEEDLLDRKTLISFELESLPEELEECFTELLDLVEITIVPKLERISLEGRDGLVLEIMINPRPDSDYAEVSIHCLQTPDELNGLNEVRKFSMTGRRALLEPDTADGTPIESNPDDQSLDFLEVPQGETYRVTLI